MKIKKRYFVVVGLLVAAIALCLVALRQREPVVRGHPVTYWVDQAFIIQEDLEISGQGFRESAETVDAAFADMDERTIDWFIRKLSWAPASPLELKINRVVSGLVRFEPFPETKDYRAVAAFALCRLGSRATKAIPALENARQNQLNDGEIGVDARGAATAALVTMHRETLPDFAVNLLDSNSGRSEYSILLFCLGTNAAQEIPSLVHALETTTSDLMRIRIAAAISDIHTQPELCLPPLMTMLAHTNHRVSAILCLKRFGKAAEPAWSNLVECLQDSDENVRRCTSNTLWDIDTNAARQLGISAPPPPID